MDFSSTSGYSPGLVLFKVVSKMVAEEQLEATVVQRDEGVWRGAMCV